MEAGKKEVAPKEAQAPKAENPYIEVVSKRLRSLNKKKRNIEQLEEQQRKGQTLNADQLAVIASKERIEKEIEDLQSLSEQMTQIAQEVCLHSCSFQPYRSVGSHSHCTGGQREEEGHWQTH